MLPELVRVVASRIVQFSRGLTPPCGARVYTPTRLSQWLIGGSVTPYIYGDRRTTSGNRNETRCTYWSRAKVVGEVSLVPY